MRLIVVAPPPIPPAMSGSPASLSASSGGASPAEQPEQQPESGRLRGGAAPIDEEAARREREREHTARQAGVDVPHAPTPPGRASDADRAHSVASALLGASSMSGAPRVDEDVGVALRSSRASNAVNHHQEEVFTTVNQATGPDGRPLNILEPLAQVYSINQHASPVRVQSQGCLMVCSPETYRVSHCSENVKSILNIEPADILGTDLRTFLPSSDVEQLVHGAMTVRKETDEAERQPAAGSPGDDEKKETDEEQRQGPPPQQRSSPEEQFPAHKDPDYALLGSLAQWIEALKVGDVPMKEIDGSHFTRFTEIRDTKLTIVAHVPKHSNCLVLDFLPRRTSRFTPHDLGAMLTGFQKELDAANNIYRGAQLAVERVNAVLQFDRAIMYRILPPCFRAEAIAEERRSSDLYPFIGLKFPGVPPDEREALVEQSARIIDDTSGFGSLIIGSFNHLGKPRTVTSPRGTTTTIFAPGSPPPDDVPSVSSTLSKLPAPIASVVDTVQESVSSALSSLHLRPSPAPPTLNLCMSFLRSPSSTHLSVLRSLGIRSSMCISISHRRQLYGVLSFYHTTQSSSWCWEEYQFVRAATVIFSHWIGQQEHKMHVQQREQLRDMSGRLNTSLDRQEQADWKRVFSTVIMGHPNLREIAGSDTFAFCCGSNWLRVGSMPAQSWLEGFLDWIVDGPDHAPDQREATGVDDWMVEKVWSTTNLTSDYPGPTPDARLAAGSLVIVLRARNPTTAIIFFRVETKTREVWNGFDPAVHHTSNIPVASGAAQPSPMPRPLPLGQMPPKMSSGSSTTAPPFLRAFQLASHASSSPWPVNSFPLLNVVCKNLVRYAEKHEWEPFYHANLQSLWNTEPENTLPSLLLREELDGVLLLSRFAKRSRPVLGESEALEERGGQTPAPGKDRILCVNQGWCEVFGFVDETAELRDRDIEKTLATAGVALSDILHPLCDTVRTIDVWSRKKGHTTLLFECFHVYSVLLDCQFNEVLAFTFTDVTLQQRVEQALLLAHQQSRRSEQAKQRMIGMVSHELRTPLTAILGFSEILANDMRLTHDQREFVSDIYSAGSHLLNIITNLLDLTKYELADAKKQPVDVIEVLKEAALWLNKTLANKLLTLQLRLPSEDGDITAGRDRVQEFVESPTTADTPSRTTTPNSLAARFKESKLMRLFTLGDAVSLKRVLINLLDNAVKFTPKLGVITVSVRSLPPLIPTQPGFIEITIRDTGIGMTSAVLDKIWEPFYQADLSGHREFGGAGLGLAMVKSIVELHNGMVSVESEPGKGSKFTLSLPMVDYPPTNHSVCDARN